MLMKDQNQETHACAMHAKTSKEIINVTRYLQPKLVVFVYPAVLFHFLDFPLPSRSKSQVCLTSPRVDQEKSLGVQEYEREREN